MTSAGRQRIGAWMMTGAVLVAAAVVPLIVRLRIVSLSDELFGYWNGQRVNYDFFSYHKAQLTIAAGVLALGGLTFAWASSSGAWRRVPAPARAGLALYATLMTMSAAWSPFQPVAWTGFCDRYEGWFVLASYLLIMAAAFTVCRTEAAVRRAVLWLSVSALIVAAIGGLQAAGADPFTVPWVARLVVPPGHEALAERFQFHTDVRPVYATLYHYNYVGSYAALVMPWLAAIFLAGTAGSGFTRGVGAAALACAGVWLACGSRAGLVGGVAGLLVVAAIWRANWLGRWPVIVGGVVAVVVAGGLADHVTGKRLSGRLRATAADVVALLSPAASSPAPLPAELVGLGPDIIRLRAGAAAVDLHVADGMLSAQVDGQPVRLLEGETPGVMHLDDARLQSLAVALGRIHGQPALVTRSGNYALNFLLLEGGIRLAMKTGRPVDDGPVPRAWSDRLDALGSARGFIWSRALPLVRGALVTGFGPDTFALVFPQQEFAGKYRVYGTTDMLVDKPHGWWLQVTLSGGVVAALALTAALVWFVVAAGRSYLAVPPRGLADAVGAASLAGVVGYVAASVFNDSVVSVAPVFWVVFGMGMRVLVDRAPSGTRAA